MQKRVPLSSSLSRFNDPGSEAQLRDLQDVLSTINPSECGQPEFDALLHVFERFPADDGYGSFGPSFICWKRAKAMKTR